MKIKQFIAVGLVVLMMGICLAACSQSNNKSAEESNAAGNNAEAQENNSKDQDSETEEHVITGIINRKDDYLVLLTKEGDYQVMDPGEGVSLDSFTEGDSVKDTYTGVLGDEANPPVISAIEMAE